MHRLICVIFALIDEKQVYRRRYEKPPLAGTQTAVGKKQLTDEQTKSRIASTRKSPALASGT